MYYDTRSTTAACRWWAINTFLPKNPDKDAIGKLELIRSTKAEKGVQIAQVARFQEFATLSLLLA